MAVDAKKPAYRLAACGFLLCINMRFFLLEKHTTVRDGLSSTKNKLIARCIILGEIRKAARFFVLTGQNRGRLFFLDFGIRGIRLDA